MVSAGQAHSLVTSGKAGDIWSFGSDGFGKLGHGYEGNEVVPRLIEALSHVAVKQVAVGYAHSMVLTPIADTHCEGRWGSAN